MSIKKITMLALGMIMLTSSVFVAEQAFAQGEVGGLPVPISESEVLNEIAQQYSLLLIPVISAIGIGAFLVKRKY